MTVRMNRLLAAILMFIAALLAILTHLGCGLNSMFTEIKPGYSLNTSQEGADTILPVILLGLETFEQHFGPCPHTVDIVMQPWPFYCGRYLAAGCSYGRIISVGVNHTSDCETIRALLHELSHACRHLFDDYEWGTPNWTWELNDIVHYELLVTGKCRSGTEELYNPYVWK